MGSERYHATKGGVGLNPYYSGAVDELALFNRELTEVEVQKLAGKR